MAIDQLLTDLAPGVILIVTLCGFAALLLTLAASRFRSDSGELVTAINALLPQTQCAQCGYPGCRPYAAAIAEGEAVNRCPPGGTEVIAALAELLGREATALDSSVAETAPPMVARIREETCIGCTLCIAACPVDAIIGAPQLMHTVLEEVCTGCDLCRPPCPVDCIDLLPSVKGSAARLQVAELTGPAEQWPEQACINCGFCATQCPRDLNPQHLYWYRQDINRLLTYKLDDCIECGICDRVCPSELPLTRTFIASKKQHRQQQAAQQLARETEAKYLRRQQRLTLAAGRIRTRPSQQDRAALLVAIQQGATRLNTVKEGDPAP